MGGQVLTSEGKTCSLRTSFTTWIIIPTSKKMRPKSTREGKMMVDPMRKESANKNGRPMTCLTKDRFTVTFDDENFSLILNILGVKVARAWPRAWGCR